MAKKKTEVNESVTAGAAIGRSGIAQPKRVSIKKHAKAKSAPAAKVEGSKVELAQPAVERTIMNPKTVTVAASMSEQDEIALNAYLYFEARGFQGGSQEQDWLRAEQEVRGRRE